MRSAAPRLRALLAASAIVISAGAGCLTNEVPATPGTPRFPDYAKPDIPPSLVVSSDTRAAHDQAWARLQAGDVGGANREFAVLMRHVPAFFPGETGLGFTFLAARQFKQAAASFTGALSRNATYIPALEGLADAHVGLRDDASAIGALVRVVAADPSRESARSRLELLRLRVVQAQLQASRQAHDAGNLEEAQRILERAIEQAPSASILLRELALVEMERRNFDSAEAHILQAIQIDPEDAEAQAALGAVLEARGRDAEAGAAFAQAFAIDPRPGWKDKADALREKVRAAAIPVEFRAIPSAATVTRAQVAAMIGMRLSELLARAPRRATQVMTDLRGVWAANWITDVVQTGIMDVLPNHTFQPGGLVRRADLAGFVAEILPLAGARRTEELARWKAARPRFVDLSQGHLSYPAAALAVASGTMRVLDGERFAATRNASGAELVAAMTRLEQIAGISR